MLMMRQFGIVRWAMRKYVRFLVLGAFSSCAFVNLALHSGAGLQYYCQEECLAEVLKGPLNSLDKEAVLHIRSHWVDPPAPSGTYTPGFPLDNPPWAKVGYWGEGYQFINDYFRQYEMPGTFVEIGAKDGEFMSLTLYLEQKLGFRGLLVEPNPADYSKIRAIGRSSYSINACATPGAGHRKDVLFLKEMPEGLPEMVQRVEKGKNTLLQFVQPEDYNSGRRIEVQCFNAGAMVVAALKTVSVDLLVVSTHAGHIEVLSSLSMLIRFRMIVVLVNLVTKEDWILYKKIARQKNFKLVFDRYNFHILLSKNDKLMQKWQSAS